MSPFRVSLKLVLDDVKRLEKIEPLRFSYVTSRCGLPPTNINGRCRKYEEPKRIYAFDRQAEVGAIHVKEQKIGHEDNVKRIRTEASNKIVKMKLAMEEEKDESREELTSYFKTELDACISVTKGDAIKEVSQEVKCEETERLMKTEKDIATENLRGSSQERTSHLKMELDACLSVTKGDAMREESQKDKREEAEVHMKTEKEIATENLPVQSRKVTGEKIWKAIHILIRMFLGEGIYGNPSTTR